MNLKYTPEIIFEHDPSLEIGTQMEKLFEKIKSEGSGKEQD